MQAVQCTVIVAVASLALSTPAVSQSACGQTEVLGSEETLEGLAERCRTTVNEILQANPNTSKTDIRAGTNLSMPSGDDETWLDRARSAVRETRETINEAATAAGRSASEYLADQPDLNRDLLEFGESLGLPGISSPENGPTLEATTTGDAGEVLLTAEGLPGNADVVITSEADGATPRTVWSGSTDRDGESGPLFLCGMNPVKVGRFVSSLGPRTDSNSSRPTH